MEWLDLVLSGCMKAVVVFALGMVIILLVGLGAALLIGITCSSWVDDGHED